MKLDEIYALWEQDSRIDQLSLSNESAKTPTLHHKYYKIFSDERLALRKLESEYKQLYLLKYDYFTGNLDRETLNEKNWEPNPRIIIKSDVSMHMEADQDIINLTLKIALQKEKVFLLESIIDTISKRGFVIKNIIDWTRFQSGG